MLLAIGVRDRDIYLQSTLSLFMTITLSLLNITAMDDWSDVWDAVEALYLACVFITLHASLHRDPRVLFSLSLMNCMGLTVFMHLKNTNNLKIVFTILHTIRE